MTTEENTEKFYVIFKKYQLNGRIEKCPCGCISDEDERKIYSKPLKELTLDDLGFYSNKAMTTWGDEKDYKHFLPRIIQIYKEDKFNGIIDLDTIYNKLVYAKWKEWDKEEQKQINEFFIDDWNELVNKYENDIWTDDFESYLSHFDFKELLEMWEFPDNKTALKNFVTFFYINGNEIIYSEKQVKIKGIDRRGELMGLLERKGLIDRLEEEFFSHEIYDKEYAIKVSTVLQMIENK